jgi:hypothetical protein
MSQRCPVCKSKLWTDPLFTPSRLVCPRCGAVFKPTVPWASFRLLVLIVLALSLAVIVFLAGYRPWLIIVFLVGLAAFIWYLPRLVDLQHISKELSLPDGLMDTDRMRLDFDDKIMQKNEQMREERDFRSLLCLVALALVVVLTLVWILLRR